MVPREDFKRVRPANRIRTRKGDERKGREEEKLPQIGGSTIQDYSLSLREACARRPSVRSGNIRRGGVGCWCKSVGEEEGTTLLHAVFFFAPASPSALRPFLPLDTCSLATDSNPFEDSGRNL